MQQLRHELHKNRKSQSEPAGTSSSTWKQNMKHTKSDYPDLFSDKLVEDSSLVINVLNISNCKYLYGLFTPSVTVGVWNWSGTHQAMISVNGAVEINVFLPSSNAENVSVTWD